MNTDSIAAWEHKSPTADPRSPAVLHIPRFNGFRPLRLGENVSHFFLTADDADGRRFICRQRTQRTQKNPPPRLSTGESPTPPSPIGWERGWGCGLWVRCRNHFQLRMDSDEHRFKPP